MRGIQLALIVIVCAMAVGCGQPNPQRPSRRMGQPQVDTMALNLMKFNQRMREEADKTLQAKAQRDPNERYALYQWGAWIHVIEPGNEEAGKPELGKECELHMRIYSLAGKPYHDTEQTAHAGKYELPTAIDANITEWHHGASVKIAAPWYAAYGIQGTAQVPPYENVIIELDIR